MSSLTAVATGLLVVFLDVDPGGWDWVADPVGWVFVLVGLSALKEVLPNHRGTVLAAWVCLVVSVLVFPPGSVATLDPTLGWLFGLPTTGFCFLLCDTLADCTTDAHALSFRLLRAAFVVVAVLPMLVYLVGADWLSIPSTVTQVVTEVAMVLALWRVSDSEDAGEQADADVTTGAPVSRVVPSTEPRERGRRRRTQGFDAEAVKARVRREREE